MIQRFHSLNLLKAGISILSILVWLANASNPPTGRTGAPFDTGSCNDCHEGGNFSGVISINGLPSVVSPNTVYPLEIVLTPQSGNPNRGGFQLVVVDGNNQNAGDLAAGNAQSGTEFFQGREYLEHRGPKLFPSGGPAAWTFTWTSPAAAARDTIRFYSIGNFCNGNGGSSGDIAFSAVRVLRFQRDSSVSTEDLSALPALRIFPNPATDQVFLSGFNDAADPLEVQLSDGAGRLVRTTTLAAGEALRVSDLAPGVYLLRARQRNSGWVTQRFIRQ